MMTEPKITKEKYGWRVDLPNGDYCYQPSQDFAVRYAKRWQAQRESEDRCAANIQCQGYLAGDRH